MDKLENLKLESWVRNVMRVLGYNPSEAVDAAARIFFGFHEIFMGWTNDDFIHDRYTIRLTYINGKIDFLKMYRDHNDPFAFRFEGENAAQLTALFSIFGKLNEHGTRIV